MMIAPRTKLLLSTLTLTLGLVACHRSHEYETQVEVKRLSVSRFDNAGNPLSTDVEVQYTACPGAQREVIRGGAGFSACMKKFKPGDRVKVKLEHHYNPEGFYDFDVYDIEGCKRPPDSDDEASYKMVRDCDDWIVNGTDVGFRCNYTNKEDLTKSCPWFARR